MVQSGCLRIRNGRNDLGFVARFSKCRLYLINSPVVRAVELKFKVTLLEPGGCTTSAVFSNSNMLTHPARGQEDGVKDTVKDVFLPWYNAYKFFVSAAIRMPAGWKPDPDSFAKTTNIMDKWIIASLQTLVKRVHTEMKAYRNSQPTRIYFLCTERCL